MRNTDAAYGAARAGDADRGAHCLLSPDAFERGVDAKAAGQCAHAFHGRLAALAHDIRCAERFRERDPVRMAAQDDDLLGAKAFGSDDAAQADRAIANHGHFLTLADLCRPRRMMAGPHYI